MAVVERAIITAAGFERSGYNASYMEDGVPLSAVGYIYVEKLN